MSLETSSYVDDDALTLDEWIEHIESCEALDVPRFKTKPDYHFIMCLDQVVMIEKEYWFLLLSDG